MALVHAEATGQLRRIAVAQARLANVLVRLGELDEADRLFTLANSPELPDRLRATIHHYAGKCAFEQDRYIEACQHFEKALELRRDGDPELVAATEVALDALFSRVAERGWGPYPRSRDEILLHPQAAGADLRGAATTGGATRTPTAAGRSARSSPTCSRSGTGSPGSGRSASRPGACIDEAGRLLIDPRGGLPRRRQLLRRTGLGLPRRPGRLVRHRQGQPGRHPGPASTTCARSGAASRSCASAASGARSRRTAGSPCSSPSTRFATGLTDGRYVEGFTDEGLAIVEVGRSQGRDRPDRPGARAARPTRRVVIHPVAFLFTDAEPAVGRDRPRRAAAGRPRCTPAARRSPTSSSSCWPTPARCSDAPPGRRSPPLAGG